MRIAQIAPLAERVPPLRYGGTERVVHTLTEELIRRGHQVTLFASGDSTTSAKLISVVPRSLREARVRDMYGPNEWLLLNVGRAYDMQKEFDIIHDHTIPASLPTANIAATPVVATMHGAFNRNNSRMFQTLRRPAIVTISQSQMYPVPGIHHAKTVYNGLVMKDYPFGEVPDEYLLFVGRISMEKGAHVAVQVAQESDRRLILAAKLDRSDEPYFREYVEPHLSERIQWVGEVVENERNRLMANALCLLHPVTWREPFGLVMIEAMACGCPVVGFNRGAVPEVIQTGKTGYVVEDVEGMLDAVEHIEAISRAACRDRALSLFNERIMADGYEDVYRAILARSM